MENLSDFDFYLKFTKPLILNLPQINDRVLAATWVRRLATDSAADEKVKLDYLKLLLFVLQRKRLTHPFTQHPSSLATLEKFPENQTLVDVAKTILEKEHQDRVEKAEKRLRGDVETFPPYISDFSADLLEYVAVQNIEDFGVHAYYAISKEPLSSWYKVDKQLLPKAAKSMLEVSQPPPTFTEPASSPELAEKPAETPPGQPPVEAPPAEKPPSPPPEEPPPSEPSKEKTPSPKKSPRKTPLGSTPPSRPIGKISPPPEDREPPTWGSNLLDPKFLEEGIGDSVSSMEGFAPPASSTVVMPMEVLWASPPTEGEEFDFFTDDVDLDDVDLDTSMPEFLISELAGEAGSPPASPMHTPPASPAFSLPYLTPRIPGVTPPPPGKPTPPPLTKRVKKAPPKTRQTRASMLLLQKKKAELAPPPPPAEDDKKKKKKPRAVVKKPKVVEAPSEEVVAEPPEDKKKKARAVVKKPKVEEAPSEEEVEAKPSKKKLLKKPSKGKVKKGAKAKTPAKAETSALLQFGSPGEPVKGFEADDMAGYVEEYNKFLADMEAQYRCDMERFQRKRLEEDQREEEGVVEEESPKRQLSRLAKRSPQSIPKDHAAAVDLDKSIHVSPEARAIFEGIIEGPSTSTGITHPYPSVMRHPIPRLEYDDDEDEDEDEDTGETEADEEVPEVPYATMETCHDHGHKDPLFVEKYNEMLDTSLKMEAVKQDRVAVEDLGDVDVANISGEDLDMLLAGLQQDAPTETEEPTEEDEFEAMEQMYEVEHPAEVRSPGARSPRSPKHLEDLQRYQDVQARVAAQMQALEEKSPSPRRSPRARQSPIVEEDDFEEMERAFEEEERAAGRSPGARAQLSPRELQAMQASPKVSPGRRSPLEQISEEDEWTEGLEYFKQADKRDAEEIAEELLPEGFMEQGLSPEKDTTIKDMAVIYRDYFESAPAFKNVPVTSPKPSVQPKRPSKKRGPIEGLINVPDLPFANIQRLKQGLPSRVQVDPERLKVQYPESPPHLEHEIQIPTSPSQVIDKLPPEAFKLDYQSPPMEFHPLKTPTQLETSWISPPRSTWYSDLDDLHRKLHGTPPRTPTIFDLPADKMEYESPPRHLEPPVSPELSPPIDPVALRKKIRYNAPFPRPRRRRVYSHGSALARREHIIELPEPPALSIEDQIMQDELAQFERITERRPIQVPWGRRKRVLPRKSAPPDLAAIEERYESPKKVVPDVFDLPPMEDEIWGEPLPEDFAPTVSPPPAIDVEELRQEMAERAVLPRRTIRTRGEPPRLGPVSEILEALGEEEHEQIGRIMGASRQLPPRERTRIARRPGLPVIGSPVQYTPSPTARFPVPEVTPGGRRGPLRRVLRKNLKKRKLFSPPEDGAPETEVEVTDVQARVVEDDPRRDLSTPGKPPVVYIEGMSPEMLKRMRKVFDLEESPPRGATKTPENPPKTLDEIMFPEVEDLDDFEPVSPMSEWETLQDMKSDVRSYWPIDSPPPKAWAVRPKRTKRHPLKQLEGVAKPTIRYSHKAALQKYPWMQMEQIQEGPEERAAEIHDILEAEVEAQMAAEAEREAAIRGTLMDQPVPEGLPSPVRPQYQVPWYTSPPELKLQPITRRPDYDLARRTSLMYGRPPASSAPGEMAAFLRMGREGGNLLEAEAAPLDEFAEPNMTVVPASPQAVAALRTPPRRRTAPKMQTMEELYKQLQAMPPSPEMVRIMEQQRIADEEAAKAAAAEANRRAALEFEYKQKTTGRKGAKVGKGVRGKAAPPAKGKAPAKPPPKGKGPAKEPPKPAAKRPSKTKVQGKALARAGVKSDRSIPSSEKSATSDKSSRSARSVKSDKSDTSVKSKGSETEVAKPKKKKKKYDVPSKLDTGLRKQEAAPAAPADKSVKSARPASAKVVKPVRSTSDRSVRSAKSDTSVKSKGSETEVAKPKKKKKKYDVPSKLDTGRKKKEPKKEKVAEIEYDQAALQDLGLTPDDLVEMNICDEPGPPEGRVPQYSEVEEQMDESEEPSMSERQFMDYGMEEALPELPDFSQLKTELTAHRWYDPFSRRKRKTVKVKGRRVQLRSQRPRVETVIEEQMIDKENQRAHAHAAAEFRAIYGPEFEGAVPSPPPIRRRTPSPPRAPSPPPMRTPSPPMRTPSPPMRGASPPMSPRTMTVQAQVHEDEGGFLEEEAPPWGSPTMSVFEAVSLDGALSPEERTAIMEAEEVTTPPRRSPGPYDYSWGGQSPIPPHEAGFKWLSSSIRGSRLPWED